MQVLKNISLFVVLVLSLGHFTQAQDNVAQTYPPVFKWKVYAITVDSAGNQYLTGGFNGTVDFNPGVGVDTKSSVGGGWDVFITRFNSDSSYAWTQTFGGSDSESGNGIAVSGDGQLYVTGSFSSNNAGIGSAGTFGTSGQIDAFVLCLDAATGQAVSNFGTGGIQKFGGTSLDYGYGITLGNNGRVYVSGYFYSTDSGIGGVGSFASTGGYDAFVLSLDATSGLADSNFGTNGIQKFGGTNWDFCYGCVSAEINGRVYVAGQFSSNNAGIGGTGTITQSGGYDGFLICLDAATGVGFSGFGTGGVQKLTGNSEELPRGIVLGTNGRVYVAGFFSSTNMGIGVPGNVSPTGSIGSIDGFVLSLDSTTGQGDPNFGAGGIQKFGGTEIDVGSGISFGNNGRIYLTGKFESTDAGIGGSGSVSSTTAGIYDALILSLDAATGQGDSNFGTGGIQKFGGDQGDEGFAIAMSPSGVLYVAGLLGSTNAGVGGPGTYSTVGDFEGFHLPLDPATGQMNQPPAVISQPSATPNPITLTQP